MPAYHDEKTQKWFAVVRYKDEVGRSKQTTKRGFATQIDAAKWEEGFLIAQECGLNVSFSNFVKRYRKDMSVRLRENTWQTKDAILEKKILPFFGEMRLNEITAADVIKWQNQLIAYTDEDGDGYSLSYLKTMHNQLSAIFNYAQRYHGLRENPARVAGSIGDKSATEMLFWTKDEYVQFLDAIQDNDIAYYAFEVFYWTGIRLGELLSLTPSDFNLERRELRITHSYQRIKGKDVLTAPKTKKSKRTIILPDFLCEEIKDYMDSFYSLTSTTRLFPKSKSFFHHQMRKGSELSGVKKIRLHDLRHSHVSLLIDKGFTALAIADRMGHEAIDITYRYAHLFPSVQNDMARCLNEERNKING